MAWKRADSDENGARTTFVKCELKDVTIMDGTELGCHPTVVLGVFSSTCYRTILQFFPLVVLSHVFHEGYDEYKYQRITKRGWWHK